MKELFNFKITIQSGRFSDDDIGRFIETCLDPYKLFWGGGYDESTIQGNVYGKTNPLHYM